MAQCSICSSPRVKEVNRWLLTGRQIGHTAKEFGFSWGCVRHHKRHHLPYRSARAPKPATAEEKLADLEYELDRLRVLAECGESVGGALRVVTQQRSLLELQLRKAGHLDATHRKLLLNARPPSGDYQVVFERGRPRTVAVEGESEE